MQADTFQKRTKLRHITCNVTCSFTHLVQTHFVPFHLFSQLQGHSVEDHLQKVRRNIYQISQYHRKQTYLFIICQPFLSFNISLLLPVQPTGKRLGGCLRCYLWEGFWSFELMAHNGLQILKDTILPMSQNCYNNVYAVTKFVKILTFVNNMNSS